MEPIIIFLDFDGVICTPRHCIALKQRGINSCLDPVALGFLNRIVKEYNCKIVISSTWRKHDDAFDFKRMFCIAGFIDLANSIHEDWSTIDSPEAHRGSEIKVWLDKHNNPEYIILDDDSDMLDYQMDRFIKTDCYNGMLMDHYIRTQTILKEIRKVDEL